MRDKARKEIAYAKLNGSASESKISLLAKIQRRRDPTIGRAA